MRIVHETTVIGRNVIIEDDVIIGPLCIIGFPPEWKGREKDYKGVIIRSGSRLTGLVTVDSGADRITEIGPDCYLMKHSHVGHDAILGKGVTVSCGAKIGGHTEIGDGTNIGLNAVIHQKLKVPGGCMIGMGAVVTKKTELNEGMKYAGNPARLLGENKVIKFVVNKVSDDYWEVKGYVNNIGLTEGVFKSEKEAIEYKERLLGENKRPVTEEEKTTIREYFKNKFTGDKLMP